MMIDDDNLGQKSDAASSAATCRPRTDRQTERLRKSTSETCHHATACIPSLSLSVSLRAERGSCLLLRLAMTLQGVRSGALTTGWCHCREARRAGTWSGQPHTQPAL
eukprot:1624893-Rhodomonas_salina.2